MGTNFYLRRNLSNDQKELLKQYIDQDEYDKIRDNLPEDIHIGKRSYGWKFLWNANKFQYFKPNIESLHEFLKSGDIYDEYGEKYTFDQFINDELKNCIDTGYDIESYSKQEKCANVYPECAGACDDFAQRYGIVPNIYGEFYIDKYRFTIWDDFC